MEGEPVEEEFRYRSVQNRWLRKVSELCQGCLGLDTTATMPFSEREVTEIGKSSERGIISLPLEVLALSCLGDINTDVPCRHTYHVCTHAHILCTHTVYAHIHTYAHSDGLHEHVYMYIGHVYGHHFTALVLKIFRWIVKYLTKKVLHKCICF